MKKILYFLLLLFITAHIWAQQVTIVESGGWLESAYVKWLPVNNAESYNVYYSGEGISDKKIDGQLIRDYGTFFRADVLGLKIGTYEIKVVPVFTGEEGDGTLTGSIPVEAHDRTGFAFSNGCIPGGYKSDGTQKDNAVVLYITENTKNIISLNVTGANVNPCVGLQTILDGFKKGDDTRPLIIRLVGQITDLTFMYKGDIVIENNNNAQGYITFEGVGDDAVSDGWGIRVKNASNIEIRNIGLMNCDSDERDNIGLQQDNDYIWVHHCDFFYGTAGSDPDQAKGDGALDCKKSGYVTISYNHFWDSGKSNLLGNGVEDPEYLTYHHNWYDHSDSRHPRVRSHCVHVYNNYFDGNAKYGVGATNASSVFVEANYFRNCKYPILISMQGSDVFDESSQTNDYFDMPTFSKEDGGSIKALNNYMTGQRRFVPYGATGYPNSTVDFDAYVAESRNETISSSVVSYQGANIYNNFDTDNEVMYTYTADTPELAKEQVMNYAGRLNGGDFKWSFDNEVDDASYDVNAELLSALVNYETSLISIQDDSTGSSGSDPDDPTDEISGDVIHNFTISGKTSSFFSITGNLSDSKGTVNYAGLELTQCLKIESITSISFTTTLEATLTLVFNSDFSGEIRINGIRYNVSSGVLSITIPAGSYEITKEDVANLYYISILFNTTDIQIAKEQELKLYPNPVSGSLNISSKVGIVKIEIYTLTGFLVKWSDNHTGTIDLSNLTYGTYLVRMHTEQGVSQQIIVKNK